MTRWVVLSSLVLELAACGGGKRPAPGGATAAAVSPPSPEAVVAACSLGMGGPLASVKVWRDAAGAVQMLEQTPDIDAHGGHAPSVFFDAIGREKGAIASQPVVAGSPEAAEFQRQRDALTGGLTAGESIACRDRYDPMYATTGEKLYLRLGCQPCHSTDGTEPNPTAGGTMKGVAGTERILADGSKVVADDAYLRESIIDPAAKMVAGYNPIMPTYRGQLSGAKLDLLVEYLKTLK